MGAGKVVHLTKQDFEKSINENVLVMVDFWASWCGPCRMVAPVMDALAEKYEGKVLIGKVDIDAEGDLAMKFGIMSIPTVMLFKNGQSIAKDVGAKPLEAYVQMIEKAL